MNTVSSYGFVILHYFAFDMTVECVNVLLKNFSSFNIHIVIVDNGSKNYSGKKLSELYKNNNQITVILNETNLGFAQGNNIGYTFLKKNFNCDFISVINNDVIIDDSQFLNKIFEIYNSKHFAVLGPNINNPKTKTHQNPAYWYNSDYLYGRTYENVLNKHNQLIQENKHLHYHLFYEKYRKIRKQLFHWLRIFFPSRKIYKEDVAVSIDKDYENVVLHGSCYIFSKDFIDNRTYAFNPNTFLYFEEDILHLECIKSNLLLLYSPKISVNHLEDVSTNSVFKTKYKKEKMIRENQIKSTQIFLDIYKDIK